MRPQSGAFGATPHTARPPTPPERVGGLGTGGEGGIRNVGIFLSQKKSTTVWVTNSALAKPVRVTLQPITLSRAKGQSPKNKDKHGFYCYPIRKANAGSVPFSTTITQSPNSYRLGFFLPVPPLKTAMTSRASRPGQRVFPPDSRHFPSLLSVGTRALATPLLVFTRGYRQQVR